MIAPNSLTLTIRTLDRYGACNLDSRVAELRSVLPNVDDNTPVPLEVWWTLSTTLTSDMWWSLRCFDSPEVRVATVRAACRAVRRVSGVVHEEDRDVYETAIASAESWCDNPIPRTWCDNPIPRTRHSPSDVSRHAMLAAAAVLRAASSEAIVPPSEVTSFSASCCASAANLATLASVDFSEFRAQRDDLMELILGRSQRQQEGA